MIGIEKRAGKFMVMADVSGRPHWCRILVDDEISLRSLLLDDLKDLHYCVGEVIAKLQRLEDKERG